MRGVATVQAWARCCPRFGSYANGLLNLGGLYLNRRPTVPADEGQDLFDLTEVRLRRTAMRTGTLEANRPTVLGIVEIASFNKRIHNGGYVASMPFARDPLVVEWLVHGRIQFRTVVFAPGHPSIALPDPVQYHQAAAGR